MIRLRSLLCNFLFIPLLILPGIVMLPLLLVKPPQGAIWCQRFWVLTTRPLLRLICGIHVNIEGVIPTGAVIIASKHQSAWETLYFSLLLEKPVFVLKRELQWIPLIGWHVLAHRPIAIDRKAGRKALEQVITQSLEKLKQGRQVVIFPEGTRVKPGEKRKYHSGVGGIYEKANVPVVPVALNSGRCWPKNSWKKYPGTITLRFLEPIQPGLKREELMRVLEERIETAQATL